MSTSNHDKVFVMTFLGVIGFLVALTVVIAGIAGFITGDGDTEQKQEIVQSRVTERLAPIGQVITDPAALKVAMSEAVEEDNRSPEEVVQGVCAACHNAGVGGAPKSEDTSAWSARLDQQGYDGLVQSVINGKGLMPARAGVPGLSDEQIDGAVKVMLEEAGVSVE